MSNAVETQKIADTELVLASSAYSFELFHKFFGGEPSEELMQAMASKTTADMLGYINACAQETNGGESAAANESFIEQLVSWAQQFAADDEGGGTNSSGAVEDLKSTYTRLFIMPHSDFAQPWESVHTSSQKLLFQDTTLAVREFYRRYGFLPAQYPKVADDHVSIECGFASQLARKALEQATAGNEKMFLFYKNGLRSFLDEHLCVWLPLYLEELSNIGESSAYVLGVSALNEACNAIKRAL